MAHKFVAEPPDAETGEKATLDDSCPATKQELNELRDQLIEKMREMQAEVLRLFDDRLRPVEIRLQTIPRLDERLGLIEERVRRLECGRLQH